MASAPNSPTVCFCIPTYNRAENLIPIVRSILNAHDPRLSVSISDNASTDNTLRMLSEIDDCRLRVQSNRENRGAIYNGLNALAMSDARYSVLLLDKDAVDVSRVSRFIDFLELYQPACGYCAHSASTSNSVVYQAGENAVRNVAYSGSHPTGYFFQASWFTTGLANKWCDPEIVGHFPLEFILAEFCMRGEGAIYRDRLFMLETLVIGRSKKSFGTNGAVEKPFFSPSERLRIAINFSLHILTLPLSSKAKRSLISERYLQGLLQATLGYRRVLADKACCEHYNIEPRHGSFIELLKIAFFYSYKFYVQVKSKFSDPSIPSIFFVATYPLRKKIKGKAHV